MYLDAVQSLKGCPRLVRSDCGTENVLIAAMQSYFRANNEDERANTNAHQYGSSPSNQRIESWWSFFRRSRSNWWIDLFKGMSDSGLLELGNIFQMKCLWFCYFKVLQSELDNVKAHWNSHYIRQSRHDTIPGVPDILYYLPENFDCIDFLVPVSLLKIQEVEPHCSMETEENAEENLYDDYFNYIMETQNLSYPTSAEEAFELFQYFNTLQR